MLRYKQINTYFFMDTFFANKEKGKSTRGHMCCQLFVTDKGFVYVVPMRRKSNVILAVKLFARKLEHQKPLYVTWLENKCLLTSDTSAMRSG